MGRWGGARTRGRRPESMLRDRRRAKKLERRGRAARHKGLAKKKAMHTGEAIVLSASEYREGTQEVALEARCPQSGCERLNVVVNRCRVAVGLDRPERGSARQFTVRLQPEGPLQPGDKVLLEFFLPGEQAGAH